MFGQYKRITNQFTGVLTGKGLEYGGSLIRPEATGYGAVYFLAEHARAPGATTSTARRAVISGSGNVATHAAEKIVQLGGKVLTLSDCEGFIHDPDGIDPGEDRLGQGRTRPSAAAGSPSMPTSSRARPSTPARRPGACPATWRCPARRRTSCSARTPGRWSPTAASRCREGANMPTDLDGVHVFKDAQDPLRAGQGRQRRRRRRLGPRDEPELRAPHRGRRRSSSRCCATSWTASTTRCLDYGAQRRRLCRLCEGRQYRRLQEGGRRDAGLRSGVTAYVTLPDQWVIAYIAMLTPSRNARLASSPG